MTDPERKTVRELVEELQKLDQDRAIWVWYDMFAAIVPRVTEADTYDAGGKVQPGDYLIEAW